MPTYGVDRRLAVSAGGRGPAIGAAFWCGIAGGVAHKASDALGPHWVQNSLIGLGLLDDDRPPERQLAGYELDMESQPRGTAAGDASSSVMNRLLALLPIHKMTDEEWEAYQQQKQEKFKARYVQKHRPCHYAVVLRGELQSLHVCCPQMTPLLCLLMQGRQDNERRLAA